MAVTGSAVPLKRYRSFLGGFLLSNAAGAAETLTLVHRLTGVTNAPVTPNEVRWTLRSVVASASNILAPLTVSAYTATNVTILAGGLAVAAAGTGATYDFTCEFCHSDNR